MTIKYLMVLMLIEGDIWNPQYFREYTDHNKCMAEAIEVQLDKENPYNAVCMPIIERKPDTPT